MPSFQNWILCDTANGTYIDQWRITNQDLGISSPAPWSITKRRLHGGLSDGVDLIEVASGELSFSVCPTRGMGIWRGSYQGRLLAWNSPVHGPVHPAHVTRDELGGIGWLAGFDEWIVRCGLNNNGGPAIDRLLDNTGAEQSMSLPLHGRIANIPAHYVEIRVNREPPYDVAVIGLVDESMLFFPQLRLATEISIRPGEPRIVINDSVRNMRSQPAEIELLYHCNFGPPLLGTGARFRAPISRLAPINEISRAALDSWDTFPEPKAGAIEQCFLMQLAADTSTGRTLAMLEDAQGQYACTLRFSLDQLPWFTLWRNPAAESDGYVTGLEPGTDLPNAKPFERQHGRVMSLAPGEVHDVELIIELASGEKQVTALREEVSALQKTVTPRIDRTPPADLAPGG